MSPEELKAALLAPRLRHGFVDIEGVGKIEIRALSREEVVDEIGVLPLDPPVERECATLACGMVSPALTREEAAQWRRASEGGARDDFYQAYRGILELSGLLKAAAKEVYREFEANPDAEFRDVPSDQAGDDAGQAQG